jgi:hypothetical protein
MIRIGMLGKARVVPYRLLAPSRETQGVEVRTQGVEVSRDCLSAAAQGRRVCLPPKSTYQLQLPEDAVLAARVLDVIYERRVLL